MSVSPVSGLDSQLIKAKRTIKLLTMAQSILGSAAPLTFAIGGLAGYQMLGEDKSLATAPLTGFNVGVALGAVAIAILAKFLGRKAAFIFGALLCSMGGVVAAIALFRDEFWLFALGLLCVGLSGGFTQKIRFAAADASPSFYKPKAISWILAGGIVSGILGPQMAIFGKDLLYPITFAGAFIMLAVIGLIGALIFSFIDLPDPQTANVNDVAARPLLEIISQPRFITGLISGIGSYSLMTFMMIGAPLAMVIGCGYSTELATLGIQWHVLAMFLPSFFTGMLVVKFGAEKVVAAGLLLLMLCAIVANAGIELWNFWGALVLLGVGWNFGFIGATSIITSTYRPSEADKVQGFHDIVLFSSVALSSFASGKVFYNYGWEVMNLIVWPVSLICLALIILQMMRNKTKA